MVGSRALLLLAGCLVAGTGVYASAAVVTFRDGGGSGCIDMESDAVQISPGTTNVEYHDYARLLLSHGTGDPEAYYVLFAFKDLVDILPISNPSTNVTAATLTIYGYSGHNNRKVIVRRITSDWLDLGPGLNDGNLNGMYSNVSSFHPWAGGPSFSASDYDAATAATGKWTSGNQGEPLAINVLQQVRAMYTARVSYGFAVTKFDDDPSTTSYVRIYNPGVASTLRITYSDPESPHTLTVDNGTGGGSYAAGTCVAVSADQIPSGWFFPGWAGDAMWLSDRTALQTTMLMPPYDTTIRAKMPETYSIAWTHQLGTASADCAYGVSADGLGNVYISGETKASLNGQTHWGRGDAFLCKYDASGDPADPIWTRQIGTASQDASEGVSADGLGYVYACGRIRGSLNGEDYDAFLCKYDASGDPIWTREFGTEGNGNEYGHSVSADGLGNVYIGACTTRDLDGTNADPGGYFRDAILRKYNDSGLVWGYQFGVHGHECSRGTAVDGLGNVYTCGGTQGSLGAPNQGQDDAFVRKYHASGNVLWTCQFGGSGDDDAYDVSADGLGNVYVAGTESGIGLWDAFVAKCDGVDGYCGYMVWSHRLGTSAADYGWGAWTDGAGNVYIAGGTYGTFSGAAQNEGGEGEDVFVSKCEKYGNLLWTIEFGSEGTEEASDISGDSLGNIYVCGKTTGSLGGGQNQGGDDAFVVKMVPLRTLTVNSGSGSGLYVGGEAVGIEADAAPTGLKFWKWVGDIAGLASTTAASTTCTMPASDVEITAQCTYRGDLNCDGFVGQGDLNIVLAQWGHTGQQITDMRADANGDSFVGQGDLDTVLAGWGKHAPRPGYGHRQGLAGAQGMFAEEAFVEELESLDTLGQISLEISQVDGNEVIPGSTVYVTNVLTITTDSDWISGQIVVSPTGVSSPIYNPMSGAYAPYFSDINGYTDEEGQWVSGHPYYAYDSFVTAGMRTGLDPYYPEEPCYVYATPGANAADLVGCGGSAVWSTSAIDQAWWTMYDDEEGERVVAQVTLKDTAQGTWSFRATASPPDGPAVLATGTIVDGVMVPDE